MTKKHFDALAAALAGTKPLVVKNGQLHTHFSGEMQTWNDTVSGVANACARFNPNFDRARFLAACGVEG